MSETENEEAVSAEELTKSAKEKLKNASEQDSHIEVADLEIEETWADENIPELKQIIGALLYGAKTPLSISQIRSTLKATATVFGGVTKQFEEVKDKVIAEAIEELRKDFTGANLGLTIAEVANGFRLQNDIRCGTWLRQLLDRGKPAKLSRPGLETLAVIAYRQPCTRSEIESVRGVSVDAMVRSLMELQLIKVVGRSELPGKPWLFGTTKSFLEHFGLNQLDDLPGMDELRRREEARAAEAAAAEAEAEKDEAVNEGSVEEETSDEETAEVVKEENEFGAEREEGNE